MIDCLSGLTVGLQRQSWCCRCQSPPLFESIDWAALMTKTLPPPFVPQTGSLPLNFVEHYMKRTPVDRFGPSLCPARSCFVLNLLQSHRSCAVSRVSSVVFCIRKFYIYVRSLIISAALLSHRPFRSPSEFPDAMADRDNSVHARSETPQGDDVATPRDRRRRKKRMAAIARECLNWTLKGEVAACL